MEPNLTTILTPPEILQRQKSLLEFIARAASITTRSRKLRSKYETQIQRFLEDETFDLNYHRAGFSPLSKAATYPNDFILTILLKSGRIDVDLRNDEGRTALSYAAQFQGASCVKTLLLHGANHDSRDNSGRCPLSWASTSSALLGNFKTQDVQGQSPLSHAAELFRPGIIRVLITSGADANLSDKKGFAPLTWAAMSGHEHIVLDFLSNATVNVDHQDHSGRTPLSYAAELGYVDITRRLVASGGDIDLEDIGKRTPLVWATIRGCCKVVDCLLSFNNANVDHQDIDNRTSLSHAAEAGNEVIMDLLMKSGADGMHANKDGHTCFWFLLKSRQCQPNYSGNPFRLVFLVAYLSNPDFRDLKGRTLLSWAAEYGDDAMVQALLENGADPNLQDNKEPTCTTHTFCRTPIIWALKNKHWSTVRMLNEKDTTSLHLLLKESHIVGEIDALELVQGLVDSKYNIEQVDTEGKRPLHLASNLSNADLARVLVSAEPALDARDNSSKTPLQYAFMQGNEGAIQLLLENGADIESIESECWLKLRAEPRLYVELTRQGTRQSYVFKPTAVQNDSHWIPRAEKYRLCLHRKDDISWSRLYREVSGKKNHITGYLCYGHLKGVHTPDNYLASHLSVSFPSRGEEGRKVVNNFWGIEWGVRDSSKGASYGFVSTLPSCGIPENAPGFFNKFLEHLQEEWRRLCLETLTDIEDIRNNQLERQGKSRIMIDRLARNARKKTELRRCLQQHIDGLRDAVDTDPIIEVDKKPQLRATINNIQKSVMAKLDEVEALVQELLQLELAWVSINEAGSIKRLSWITFIFLPLMFVSSLFGMNIDLLQNNPDWRWYLLFGGSSLLLNASIWIIFKYVSFETWLEERRLMRRKNHRTVSDAV
ncbi:ankyrin repeat-containing domain protein [Aspergillus cavernicola]|uniref:Ankyrin repeat-containing domain protein n=1 Tax=Aspergillus cavernicola TaxID=176166 RepID=A0ABR4H9W6_9EURO